MPNANLEGDFSRTVNNVGPKEEIFVLKYNPSEPRLTSNFFVLKLLVQQSCIIEELIYKMRQTLIISCNKKVIDSLTKSLKLNHVSYGLIF